MNTPYQKTSSIPVQLFLITLLSIFILNPFQILSAQGSIEEVYIDGDIPTGYNAGSWDPECNGESTTIKVVLPAGYQYEVTGIDIGYTIKTGGNFLLLAANSQLYCQNTSTLESAVYEGSINGLGEEEYYRSNVSIANGIYHGETELIFEMRAWRDYDSSIPGCNTEAGSIIDGTWKITVYFGPEIIPPRVGINTSDPSATLEVAGEVIISETNEPGQPGMMKYNMDNNDFLGYNGTEWKSLTYPSEINTVISDVNNLTNATRSYEIMYNHYDFRPFKTSVTETNVFTGGKWTVSGHPTLYNSLNLPVGAIIDSVVVYYMDNTLDPNNDGLFTLYRSDIKSNFAETMLQLTTVASNVGQIIDGKLLGPITIESGYIYYLAFTNENNDSLIRINGAKVNYRLDIFD